MERQVREDGAGQQQHPAGVAPGEEVVSFGDFHKDVLSVLGAPCRVTAFEVVGNTRTRAQTVERAFEAAEKAETFEGVARALDESVRRLEALRVLRSVDATALPHPYNAGEALVRVQVEEGRALSYELGVYTNPRTSQVTFEAKAGLRNAFGRFEHIQGAAEISQDHTLTYALRGGMPWAARSAHARGRLEGEVRRISRRWDQYSSINESAQGAEVGYDSGEPVLGKVGYELTWRELGQASLRTSSAIRRQAGHAIKSALSWTASAGEVDSESRPRSGAQLKWQAKLCGVGPDARMLRFARAEAHAMGAWPLIRGGGNGGGGLRATLVCQASGGVIVPWGGPLSQPATVVDKFFLGGSGDLRGFAPKGAGPTARRRNPTAVGSSPPPSPSKPRVSGSGGVVSAEEAAPMGDDPHGAAADGAGRDVLGGDIMAFASAALHVDPPARGALWGRLRDAGIYGQLFADCGALTTLSRGAESLPETLRVSWGAGVAWPILPNVAIEVNYNVVAHAQAHDRISQGWGGGFVARGGLYL